MNERFELRIPPSPSSVAAARGFVVDVAAQLSWFDEGRLDDLRLLVSEITTNAVRAQLRHGSSEPIEVWCAIRTAGFVVEVHDHAGGFDAPDPPRIPDPSSGEEGGFGLAIVSTLADDTHFQSNDGGTIVRFVLDAPSA